MGGLLGGLILIIILYFVGFSRRSSSAKDFLKALQNPSKAKQYKKARFDTGENFAAFRKVLSSQLHEPLTPEIVRAMVCVAPETKIQLELLIGSPIGQAIDSAESAIELAIKTEIEKKEFEHFFKRN